MDGDSLDETLRSEMKQAYGAGKKNWHATDKFSERTPGLFKPEFVGVRGIWLFAKCYLVQMRPMKINIAEKVFQRIIMICIFSAIRMSCMFF